MFSSHFFHTLFQKSVIDIKSLVYLSIVLTMGFLLSGITPFNKVYAFDVVQITNADKALDLTEFVEIFHQQGQAFQVSTTPDSEGIVRRIEVRASSDKHNGDWAVFVLANTTSEQIDRLFVAPHYRLANAGIIWPDLGDRRIINITPSEGFALDQEQSDDADVFRITLNPGTVVTFVAELASKKLPQLHLWEPESYKETVNSFTLYKGILIGIAGLLAVFVTNLFIVRWTITLPATAMLAWTVLIYIGIDFGFLSELFKLGPQELQFWRAGAEVLLAGGLVIFLFTYLNLHNWHINLSYVALAWLAGLTVLFSIVLIDASIAAGIARISFAVTVLLAVFLIGCLAYQGYDRAFMLVPTWILMLCWLAAASLTAIGEIDNDIIQPALGGGMVLIVLLISFTVMQHVFTADIYQKGLFSDAERQSLALMGSGDIVWDWDIIRDRLTINPDISRNLGMRANSLQGVMRNWLPIIHPNDRDSFSAAIDIILERGKGRLNQEFRLRAIDGHHHWFLLKARPVIGANGDVIRCVGTIEDVSEHKTFQARLLHNSIYDHLTGLANEELFLDRLNMLLSLGENKPELLPTILVIDLDNFKRVNKIIGMSAGDTIMLALTHRIKQHLQDEDLFARLGRDQFGIILLSETDPDTVAKLAEAINDEIRKPLDFAKKELSLSVSIGMLRVINTAQTSEDILKDAELAMLHARRFGGNRIEPFRPAFRSTGVNYQSMQESLKTAIVNNEMKIVYQPVVTLDTLELVGFEALLRWESPKRGLVPPSEFVPLAEKTGFISELGMYAFKQSVKDMSSWQASLGQLPFFISVNLSAAQLQTNQLYDEIKTTLEHSDCLPSNFKLELTETVVMGNPDIATVTFSKLKQLGIGLALDDFGTGYSSMYYLSMFPFDILKIDRSIVTGKGEKRDKMLTSIINLSKELGLEVIAEGIDSSKNAEELSTLGCDYGQSFLFGAPINARQTLKLLKTRFSTEK